MEGPEEQGGWGLNSVEEEEEEEKTVTSEGGWGGGGGLNRFAMGHHWTAEKAGFLRWTVRVQDGERERTRGDGRKEWIEEYEAV